MKQGEVVYFNRGESIYPQIDVGKKSTNLKSSCIQSTDVLP